MIEQRPTPLLDRDVLLRDDGSDREVWSATFEGQYHVPPATMPVPATVLDLGANIGLTMAHYRLLWPDAKIIGVEMDDECAILARLNSKCEVLGFAVSGDGLPGFYDPAIWPSNYSLGAVGPRPVTTRTLREIIDTSFGGPVDFVKMDVEGEEWSIFKHGDWAPLVKHLLVELHGDEEPDAMVERAIWMLNRLGFQAQRHMVHPQAVWAWS